MPFLFLALVERKHVALATEAACEVWPVAALAPTASFRLPTHSPDPTLCLLARCSVDTCTISTSPQELEDDLFLVVRDSEVCGALLLPRVHAPTATNLEAEGFDGSPDLRE